MTARLVTLILSDDGKQGRGIDETDPVRSILRAYTPAGRLVFSYDHHLEVGSLSADGWRDAMTSPEVAS